MKHEMRRFKWHYQKSSGGITQNVTNKNNVTHHMLKYPDPATTRIRYPAKFATRPTSNHK